MSPTTLTPGTRLGPFEILSSLGEGGMGAVYRARDAKLNRDVAIKVLLPAVANDPDRLARFSREAQVLASLNHSNIAQIFGIEESSGVTALVMELVEGEDLSQRIARGPIPLNEALPIARQIAEALEAAHEQGIIHRDLKPANIKVRPDGMVKVLDFGLAKAMDPAGTSGANAMNSPTLSVHATQAGILLGTAAYMSPEQARGIPIDKRTDIWAFGCVLFEMLTGRRPFDGETTADFIAAVLQQEPDWARLPADVPPNLQRLLHRTLAKPPKLRLHDIADARIEIDESAVGSPKPSGGRRGGRRLAWVAGAAMAAVVVSASWLLRPADLDESRLRFIPFSAETVDQRSPAWSPDGRSIVYVAAVDTVRQVFVRSFDSAVPAQVTKGQSDCDAPFWAPDGTRIYFNTEGSLWSVGVAGGQPRLIVKDAGPATASPDGTALAFLRGVGGGRSLWITPTATSAPQPYRQSPFPEKFTRSDSIDFSPDGSKIAVLVEQQVGTALSFGLWVVPYPVGQPRLAIGPLTSGSGPFGFKRISWASDSRHIVFQNALPDEPGSHLNLVDTDGGTVRRITSGTGEEWTPAVSPDGRRIAFASGANDFDIVQGSLDGGDVYPLLATGRSEQAAAWAPAGTQFAYVTNMRGHAELWIHRTQEGESVPILTQNMEGLPTWYNIERPVFSADGQKIAYGAILGERHAIWISPTAGGRPVPIDPESPDQHGAAWSPDGNWIAYQRLSAGHWELVKLPLGSGKAVRLSDAAAGGGPTAWSPTGAWLAQRRGGSLELVSADGSAHKTMTSPNAAFGFSRDGSQLYVIRRAADQHWELAALGVPGGEERSVVRLKLPSTATVSGFSLHPDGRSFITSTGTARFDIWLLEGFKPPSMGWIPFWRNRH